jgi:hypothetical protein
MVSQEKGWIQRVDNGGWAITAVGVDTVIENDLPVKGERLLPAADETSHGPDDGGARRKNSPDPASHAVSS